MFPGFDPSKLDPKVVQELTDLMRTLPPEKLMRMQTMMHNSMAGFDISVDVQSFERDLPPDFRAKLAKILLTAGPLPTASTSDPATDSAPPPVPSSIDEARLTILRAVRDGSLSPEDALQALFS